MGQLSTKITTFRDLRVWQEGMDLVEETYRLSQHFPPSETYGLLVQIRRAAVSVPSNIAEGRTRGHLREYQHHLSMAQASLAELETQFEIAARLKYLSSGNLKNVLDRIGSLRMQLCALRKALADNDSAYPKKAAPETRNLKPET